MSKKKTKIEEPIISSEENQNKESQPTLEENTIDRPWWVDQQKWDSLTDEEKVRFIQENQ